MEDDKLITLAIHTYEKAQIIKGILESEGIPVVIQNVNLVQPVVSSGVRIRIKEKDLPHALEILEQYPIFGKETEVKAEVVSPQVLIPVDFSDYSYKACQIGFDFAHSHNAEVILLHSVNSYYTPLPMADSFKDEISELEAYKQMQEMVSKETNRFSAMLHRRIEDHELPYAKFTFTIQDGIPEDVIISTGKRAKPIITVMGTRGKNQKELDLIGSVTAEVLDAGKFPVFAVPENIPYTSIERIKSVAFFTNFDQQDLIALDTFMRLMGEYEFGINFVHLSNRKDAWTEIKLVGIKDYFEKHYKGRQAQYTMLNEENFLDNVEKIIKESAIDLLAMPNRKRNIFARLFNPSIAHKMLFHADTPLLVIPS
ncbi:MAG: universal stress protein [Barnesiella sp.]